MPKSQKILMICLLLLTACATSNNTEKQSVCSSDHVKVLNRKTDKYDCVSKLEWENLYGTYDEENW
jgi:hypothetical protein